MDLSEISVDGGVGGVHDEEREGQVQHNEGHRVGDVTPEYHTGGDSDVRYQCMAPVTLLRMTGLRILSDENLVTSPPIV